MSAVLAAIADALYDDYGEPLWEAFGDQLVALAADLPASSDARIRRACADWLCRYAMPLAFERDPHVPSEFAAELRAAEPVTDATAGDWHQRLAVVLAAREAQADVAQLDYWRSRPMALANDLAITEENLLVVYAPRAIGRVLASSDALIAIATRLVDIGVSTAAMEAVYRGDMAATLPVEDRAVMSASYAADERFDPLRATNDAVAESLLARLRAVAGEASPIDL